MLQLALDRLVLVPVGQAPHREPEDDPGAEVRLEMVELAVAGDDRFSISRTEIDRQGPSYTADTLAAMRAESPDAELFLILGGDQAAALPSWHEPERVLEHATVAVVARTGWTRERNRHSHRAPARGRARALSRHAADSDLLDRDSEASARRLADPLSGSRGG